MKKYFIPFLLLGVLFFFAGCAYKAYLGLHGSSIKMHPDTHQFVSRDTECLECHHPENHEGPATPHPGFKGCLKCHNDAIQPVIPGKSE